MKLNEYRIFRESDGCWRAVRTASDGVSRNIARCPCQTKSEAVEDAREDRDRINDELADNRETVALFAIGNRVGFANSEVITCGTIESLSPDDGTVFVRWDQTENYGETFRDVDAGELVPMGGW